MNDVITIGKFNDSVVTVRLQSIQHLAGNNDEIADEFDVTFAVTGAGEVLKYADSSLNLAVGNAVNVGNSFNHFNYDDTSCGGLLNQDMNFSVLVITAAGVGAFNGNAKGQLKPGVLTFKIPVAIESGKNKSTLVLRGRIDVSCPN